MGRRRWVILAVAAAVAVATVAARTAFDAAASFRGPEVIAAGQGPGPLALSPDGRFLYAADFGTFTTPGRAFCVPPYGFPDAQETAPTTNQNPKNIMVSAAVSNC
jgi:DNA-binding beta-propeller fold protein YncE